MAKDKSILEKAEEIGLDKNRIAAGLKSDKKHVTEAVEAAYKFMKNKGGKK